MVNEHSFSMQFDSVPVFVLAGRARGRCEALNRLPLLPALADELEITLAEQSIHATAAIAGNPMRLDEIHELLAPDNTHTETPAGPTVARARREITNLGLAYAPLPKRRTESGVFGISEGFLRKVHTVVVQGTVASGTGEYPVQVREHLLDLIAHCNAPECNELEPAVRAALLHYHLYRLRPFSEGNGRVARFFESSVLAVGGYRFASMMLPLYYRRRIDDYLRFFPIPDEPRAILTGDDSATAFLVFMLEGLLECLDTLHERLAAPLRRLALSEHFRRLLESREINRRSHDLLLLLLDRETVPESGVPLPFQIRDLFLKNPYKLLYDKVSEHTARRDLNRMLDLGLLLKDGTSYLFQDRHLG
ncbi:MAG: Fic family protein [Desulfovibrio sp.]